MSNKSTAPAPDKPIEKKGTCEFTKSVYVNGRCITLATRDNETISIFLRGCAAEDAVEIGVINLVTGAIEVVEINPVGVAA